MAQTSGFVIRAANISKQVDAPAGRLSILKNINLKIKYGETLAVMGVSGSGKSTLLGILAGLDRPSQGQVMLGDTELTDLSESDKAGLRNRRVGFVFQAFHLLPGLTALENVMLPLELGGEKAARAVAQQRLEAVGLSSRSGHYPNQLSGGEQQRVAIARAFASNPEVLFADEPTGNLDRTTATQVADLLFNLNQEHGATLVLVTHDATIAARCSRVLTLEGGRVAPDATGDR